MLDLVAKGPDEGAPAVDDGLGTPPRRLPDQRLNPTDHVNSIFGQTRRTLLPPTKGGCLRAEVIPFRRGRREGGCSFVCGNGLL